MKGSQVVSVQSISQNWTSFDESKLYCVCVWEGGGDPL